MGMIERMASYLGFEKRAADTSWAALAPGIGYHAGLSARAAENLSSVLACTGVISTSLASIPALIYRREGSNRIEALGHPLTRITRTGVTEGMTWPDFIEHMVASALLTGNVNNLFDRKYWQLGALGEARNGSLSLRIDW